MAWAQQIRSISVCKNRESTGNCESDILQNNFIHNDSRKNQGKSHTLLRLSQRILLSLQKIVVGLDIFRTLLFNDDSRKNQGGLIGKMMTQNTTKNDNGSNVTHTKTH